MQKRDELGRLKYFHPISEKLTLACLLILDLSTYQITILLEAYTSSFP